jgi:hypothetical protein
MNKTMRAVAASALGAAALVVLTAPAAQASEWRIRSKVYVTYGAAAGELPGMEARCRQTDGNVVESQVIPFFDNPSNDSASRRFYAYVLCRSKRG